MSSDDPNTPMGDDINPLAEAIFEAADDLEKGRPLSATATEPLTTDEVPVSPELGSEGYEPPAEEVQEVEAEEPAEADEKKPSLWSRLSSASPYTVMLAITMVAVLIGIVCMGIELSSYGWDFRKGK